jgi:hypothetical protein
MEGIEELEKEKRSIHLEPNHGMEIFSLWMRRVLQDLHLSSSLEARHSKALKTSPYLKAVKAIHNDDDDTDRSAPRIQWKNRYTRKLVIFPAL